MTSTAPPAFSRAGLGAGLAHVFERRFASGPPALLAGPRGQQLLVVCDIGGCQRSQRFETFSFIILDLDRSTAWGAGQRLFRSSVLATKRRMAFKALNDGMRRRALTAFLALAESIDGVLVTFATDKNARPSLGAGGAAPEELTGLWKPAVVERLMWVIYLAAFLADGFSTPGQHVMFIIDEDDVAANVAQLTKLTELLGRAISSHGGSPLGHLRVGTTWSDDGSLTLEDLAALPDLAAGASAELLDALEARGLGVFSPLLQRLPAGVTWKTRRLLPWLLTEGDRLERVLCMIDGSKASSKWRATVPSWRMVEDTGGVERPTFG